MPFAELLRATVFLCAGGATTLAVISVIGVREADNTMILVIGAVWWVVAAWIGLSLGAADRSAEAMRETLAGARTVTTASPGLSMPTPGRVAWGRLSPILVAVGLAGAVGVILPEVAVVGSGYALLVALAWRNREAAVLAIEGRDGVRFLVESASPLKPVKLLRTPGFRAF
ncbi:MAG: hypothetical protein KDB48_02945 [Solirubrobacterales bacterium]|nr:hypothetical protein [Solirubrobacterales bacterium]HMT05348.1 hypothetical protein [Solirubrobacterales bacterium]